MKYNDWLKTVPAEITEDLLWKVEAYRLALFAADLGWHDVKKLMNDRRTLGLSDQLYRALGSIGANISEGYSRSSGKDRVRFYEYALGSARESRGWIYKGRHILGSKVTEHRIDLLTQIARLLLVMIPDQRATFLSEVNAPYLTELEVSIAKTELPEISQNAPITFSRITHHASRRDRQFQGNP